MNTVASGDIVPIKQPYAYTGREYDRETGAHGAHRLPNFPPDPSHVAQREAGGGHAPRARYYMPEIGRFIQQDPIKFRSGDANFYAYVVNRPIDFIDPGGLAWTGRRAFEGNNWQSGILSHSGIIMSDGKIYGYFDDGKVRQDKSYYTLGDYIPSSKINEYDDQLMLKAMNAVKAEWEAVPYKKFTHNCHQFVEKVIQKYNQLLEEQNSCGATK